MEDTNAKSLRRLRSGRQSLVLLLLFSTLLVAPASAMAGFGIEMFIVSARDGDGTIDGLAATHPFVLDVHLSMNTSPEGTPDGELHAIAVDLPPGLLGNPLATPTCSPEDFETKIEVVPGCAGSTQVGILRAIVTGLGRIESPVYNLAPTSGTAGSFGVSINGEAFIQSFRLIGAGSSSSIRLSGVLSPESGIVEVEEEIWGVPADPGHDAVRTCQTAEGIVEGCPSEAEERPLLTLPASCAEPLRTAVAAASSGPPGQVATAVALSRDAGGNTSALVGCERVPFDPRFTVQTEGSALVPTPLSVGVEMPQPESVGTIGSAPLAGLRIELPEGLAINPSSGAWLASCSPAAVGLKSPSGDAEAAFDDQSADCPAAARLGSVKLRTPVIDHALTGTLFLATPFANPFDARFAIYLVVEDEASGTILKIPGRIDADPADGRLTVAIPELPWLPFSEMQLEFVGGSRAPLVDPPSCGKYSTEATFTPSTAPSGLPATRTSTFAVSVGAGGRPCPPPEVQRDATPAFQAGTEAAYSGRDSPLVIDLSREDLAQHFGSFALTLPPGLIANLGSVSVGAEVGSVRVETGEGPQPLALGGTVYLDGPYKRAPFSLRIVVPGQVGPFDLGTIVERVAVDVDPATAQVSVRADPLPQILEGVPLQLRGVQVDLDRPGFIRNPTSCEPTAISGSATTSLGQVAPLSTRFQVGGCAGLPFRPKLSLRFGGAIGADGHPAIRAIMRSAAGEATASSAGFNLPAGELLDLRHLRTLCPRDLAVDECPRTSRLGTLRIETPFLDAPFEGPVYLRVPAHRLPELSAELRSGSLAFVLQGRTTDAKGRFGFRLVSIPDIPISEAVLSLPGGRRGIIVNSRSLCGQRPEGQASLSGHNGARRREGVPVRVDGCR